MTSTVPPPSASSPADEARLGDTPPVVAAPFVHAPEGARTIFLVILAAACGPLLAGLILFGWRAAIVAALAILSCVVFERLYYFVARTPALLGRSHGWLTGVLLALTLPPFAPWYVPIVAGAFAIIVGKAVFGGVGHFLWQPALVGRLAVAVVFAHTLTNPFPSHSNAWPVLAQEKLLVGDVLQARRPAHFGGWRGAPAPAGADALLLTPPWRRLEGLTAGRPEYSALAFVPSDVPAARPAALTEMPPISDLIYGARPGNIGETCAVVIIVAGLYLVYRNYVKWRLPVSMILAAAVVAAVAPVHLAGEGDAVRTVWRPATAEGLDVGLVYVSYQVLSFELLLAAFFFATEMTSRPVTAGGQVIFGAGAGAAAMLLHLYLDVPVPAFMAVLAMNSLTPMIDAAWRPRVFGRRRWPVRLIRRLAGRGEL